MLILDESAAVRWANQQAVDLWGGGITLQMIGRPLSALLQFHHLDRSPMGDEEPSHPLQKALRLRVAIPISSNPYLILLLKRTN